MASESEVGNPTAIDHICPFVQYRSPSLYSILGRQAHVSLCQRVKCVSHSSARPGASIRLRSPADDAAIYAEHSAHRRVPANFFLRGQQHFRFCGYARYVVVAGQWRVLHHRLAASRRRPFDKRCRLLPRKPPRTPFTPPMLLAAPCPPSPLPSSERFSARKKTPVRTAFERGFFLLNLVGLYFERWRSGPPNFAGPRLLRNLIFSEPLQPVAQPPLQRRRRIGIEGHQVPQRLAAVFA